MASNTTAYLHYDTEIMTNYIQDSSSTSSASPEVQTYTINVQCFDGQDIAIPGSSVLIQTSSPIDVHLNGEIESLSITPIRYAFDETGEICILAPSTGLTTPTYTFSTLQDVNGKALNLPITTIDPSSKVLKQFQSIQTGSDLKTKPGRWGTTLYAGKTSTPSDTDLNAAAKMFNDMSSASATMPTTPPEVLTTSM